MVKVGTVWDAAVEAVRGRMNLILPVAAFALFLPSVVQTGLTAYAAPVAERGVGASLLAAALLFGTGLLTLWGSLAITAITSDPATTSGDAGRLATARLLPLLGVSIVLGFAAMLLLIPPIALIAGSGVNLTALNQPGAMTGMGGGTALSLGLYALLLIGFLLWITARLLPLAPTVLHERLGLGAIGRTFRLTRGAGLKLVGVIVLYGIVVGVASGAAQAVSFILFRLLLGAENIATATFLAGIVSAVIATVLSVLATAFIAQLYVRLSGRDLVDVFGDARPAT